MSHDNYSFCAKGLWKRQGKRLNVKRYFSLTRVFTIITVNMQKITNFKMACMNKLERNDYKESSLSIYFSLLITFNLPLYWNLIKNSDNDFAIPTPSQKFQISRLSHDIAPN